MLTGGTFGSSVEWQFYPVKGWAYSPSPLVARQKSLQTINKGILFYFD